MTLEEKIKTIGKTSFPIIQSGYAENIETFWNEFVGPRLPQKEIVVAWHELLLRYVQDKDSVFVIRAFSNTNTTPRRGLLTKTDKDFAFTYSDKGFAKLIAKMVFDDFVPQYDEFKNAMLSGKIPVPEFQGREESSRAFYKIVKLNYSSYKLAHIVDSGKDFFIHGQNYGLTEICKAYFPAGNFDDWKKEDAFYVRNLQVDSEAREIITAYFLRYVDPLNYFLTPKSANKGITIYTTETGIKDIAEYKPMQLYAMQKFFERYGQIYSDYLQLLKISPEIMQQFEHEKNLGSTVIKIHYDENINCKTPHEQTESHNSIMQLNRTEKCSATIKKSEKLSKQQISDLCKENGIPLNISNTTLAGRKGNYYPANVNFSLLDKDWWIALDDRELKKLHIFHVPASSISKDKMIPRADKRHIFLFYIYWNSPSFLDSKSNIEFKQWLVKTISY